MIWLEHTADGTIKPASIYDMNSAKIVSQTPAGSISISNQKSGWIAKTADGRMFDEESHDWSLVPKDMILDIRLLLNNSNVAIPKLDIFNKFMYLKRGDGKTVGMGAAITNSDKIAYLIALNKRDGIIYTIDTLYNIELLPMVSSIEFVEPNSIPGNIFGIELPSKMIIIPKRERNNYFFQYKDGALLLSVGHSVLFGQVIGMITNPIGNCLVLYYDQGQDSCLVSVDNVFNMKVSLKAQGLSDDILINPLLGNV